MKFERGSSLGKLSERLGIDAEARTTFAATNRGLQIVDLDSGRMYTFNGGLVSPIIEAFEIADQVRAVILLSDSELCDRWVCREEVGAEDSDTLWSELYYRGLHRTMKSPADRMNG